MMNLCKRPAVLASVALVVMAVGCGGEKKAKNTTPVVNATQASKPVDVSSPDSPATPPPPSADSPASVTAAPVPAGVSAGSASVNTVGGDPLFYFRKSPAGQVLDDVGALQQATEAYGMRADIAPDATTPPWPNLKGKPDLTLLVKSGLLKALPTPPPGQKFIFDPKTMKVGLAPE